MTDDDRTAVWSAMPGRLPDLSLAAAAALRAGRWDALGELLREGALEADRAGHPTARAWLDAVASVQRVRTTRATDDLEAVRTAVLGLLGGAP